MLKIPFFLVLFILSFFSLSAASTYSHKWYDWENEPKLYELSAEESKSSAVIIKDKRILEYVYDDDKKLVLYETKHKIIRINDDAAAENFNKVVVPTRDINDFMELKARAISPAGKITLLNRDNIKELDNIENMGGFKIFAIEGVEKGGEVEYFYTTKSDNADLYGRETEQNMFSVKTASIDIITPKNLIFETKSYNGFPDLSAIETDSIRTLSATLNNIPPILEETYANYQSNLMYIDYKATYNKEYAFKKKLYDWDMASENFSTLIYNYSPVVQKMVLKELKKQKLLGIKNEEQRIIAIEKYLKNTIALQAGSSSEFVQIDKIMTNHYASELGICRIFAAFLTEAGISHELIITSDKTNARFDQDFASWNSFTDILFFFPKSQKYIAPTVFPYRYGFAPYNYTDNYGLFINNRTYQGKVKQISSSKANDNINGIKAVVNLDNISSPIINFNYTWTGYRAAEFRTFYQIQKDEGMKPFVTASIDDAKVINLKVSNGSIEDSAYPEKIFTIDSQVEIKSLIERAGSSYLFKVGEIIGGQQELYQEHERQNPIDMQYPIKYTRQISFTVPKGYTVKGLETAKIDKYIKNKETGEYSNRFLSDYEQKDNQITINCTEYYEQVSLPKSEYEPFREVINAAADFNKIVLVFEKN